MRKLAVILFCSLMLLMGVPSAAQPSYIKASRLGITFISSLDHPANDLRYQRALLLGAGWNRWPLYWDRVEGAPGSFDWTGYDRLVSQDMQHGLQVDAILLGSPSFHRSGGTIEGINAPAFSDGTDAAGGGKTPNSGNPWAMFVYQAVLRYKPGGLLAQQGLIPSGAGITVWEAWNEPDLSMFWSASPQDYARLLKVTYLVVHTVDPNARVMFGGLAYGNPDKDDWLAHVLAIYANDSGRGANNWYMDIVGVHNYSYAKRSGLVVRRINQTLAKYGIYRPVWLNESGVPVWDDYPGPTGAANDPASRALRATMQQQANFVVESTAYAWAEGADVVFIHQLYDDCGNQAGGTNFAPNSGQSGDAYGLYRNERNEPCYSQSPLPGTPRPAAAAFYRMAQIFGILPFGKPDVEFSDDGGIAISFDRLTSEERIVVVWNRRLEQATMPLKAAGEEARFYSITDQDWLIKPTNGEYKIGLPGATRDDYPYLPSGEVSGIGGVPYIVVEKKLPQTPTPDAQSGVDTQILLTPGALTATQPPRPTLDPALDTNPPSTTMNPLPVVSPATFTVYWSGQDDSGIQTFLVWVRIDGGQWQPWIEATTDTQAQYTGESGKRYDFAVWAQDLAGNWSLNTELTPQATTAVQ
ncbi:MAG: hypothetical protein ABI690_08920 [Chloroflexota bacterium]